jgi:hypothetical protein
VCCEGVCDVDKKEEQQHQTTPTTTGGEVEQLHFFDQDRGTCRRSQLDSCRNIDIFGCVGIADQTLAALECYGSEMAGLQQSSRRSFAVLKEDKRTMYRM